MQFNTLHLVISHFDIYFISHLDIYVNTFLIGNCSVKSIMIQYNILYNVKIFKETCKWRL